MRAAHNGQTVSAGFRIRGTHEVTRLTIAGAHILTHRTNYK